MRKRRVCRLDELKALVGPKSKSPVHTTDYFRDNLLDYVPDTERQVWGRARRLSEEEEWLVHSVLDAINSGVFKQMSFREAQCFQKVIISGEHHSDVAREFNITKSSVQTYVARAAKIIRKYIEDHDGI